jgi:hypothetical protein
MTGAGECARCRGGTARTDEVQLPDCESVHSDRIVRISFRICLRLPAMMRPKLAGAGAPGPWATALVRLPVTGPARAPLQANSGRMNAPSRRSRATAAACACSSMAAVAVARVACSVVLGLLQTRSSREGGGGAVSRLSSSAYCPNASEDADTRRTGTARP